MMLRSLVGRLAGLSKYRLLHSTSPLIATDDLEADFLEMYEQCRPFTMTSLPRMYALYQAVRHVAASNTGGSFVECGVWRGGSAMLAALAFMRVGQGEREL